MHPCGPKLQIMFKRPWELRNRDTTVLPLLKLPVDNSACTSGTDAY
jgi:hypothetical protein